MKKCKLCGKDLLTTTYGLKAFCSHLCQKTYRQEKQSNWLKNKRNQDCRHLGQYDRSSSQNVDSGNPLEKPIYESPETGHGLSEDRFSSSGGKEWYDMAKTYCCNFEVREKEGNCLTLCEPYFLFKKPCNECDLGMTLNLKYK